MGGGAHKSVSPGGQSAVREREKRQGEQVAGDGGCGKKAAEAAAAAAASFPLSHHPVKAPSQKSPPSSLHTPSAEACCLLSRYSIITSQTLQQGSTISTPVRTVALAPSVTLAGTTLSHLPGVRPVRCSALSGADTWECPWQCGRQSGSAVRCLKSSKQCKGSCGSRGCSPTQPAH